MSHLFHIAVFILVLQPTDQGCLPPLRSYDILHQGRVYCSMPVKGFLLGEDEGGFGAFVYYGDDLDGY